MVRSPGESSDFREIQEKRDWKKASPKYECEPAQVPSSLRSVNASKQTPRIEKSWKTEFCGRKHDPEGKKDLKSQPNQSDCLLKTQ